MNRNLAAWLMLGGFLGTVAHTLVMYLGGKLGLEPINIAGILGSPIFSDWTPPLFASNWLAGMMFHFALGVVFFPLAYAVLFKKALHRTSWLTGLIWGIAVWAAGQFVFMPLIGRFDYFQANPLAFLTYLLGHMAYGTIFGATVQRHTRTFGSKVHRQDVLEKVH